MAAGMEFDNSDDEFMFADDNIDSAFEVPDQKFAENKSESLDNDAQTEKAPWNSNKAVNADSSKNDNQDSTMHKNSYSLLEDSPESFKISDDDMRAAILKGDLQYVANALNSGFDAERKVKSGWTSLMFAANNAQVDILNLLLQHGANANFKKDLYTPLMALCSTTSNNQQSIIDCATSLLEAGANVNAHDRHLMTPLMFAAQRTSPDVLELLIQKGAEVNAQENRGWTALAFAAHSGNANSVKLLLKLNANSSLSAFDGQCPADLAYSRGFATIAALLDDSNSISKRPDSISQIRYKKLEDLEMFLFGLDLGHLVELFQDQNVAFQDFLKLTDEELKQLGVNQLGDRRKILETLRGIHTNEWDLSGLTIDKNSKIKTIEAAAIISNITKHIGCIQSSVAYLCKYIKSDKELIKEDERSFQKTLVLQCKDALEESARLQKDLIELQTFVNKEFASSLQEQCNFIGKKGNGSVFSKQRTFVKSILCLSFFGVFAVSSFKLFRSISR
eukprot:gene147-9764_t